MQKEKEHVTDMKRLGGLKLGKAVARVAGWATRTGPRAYFPLEGVRRRFSSYLLRLVLFSIRRSHRGAPPRLLPPKGHLPVYVGEQSEESSGQLFQYMVSVVQVNHPLFKELLMESEAKFGFDYPSGVIVIPCPVAQFEHTCTRISNATTAVRTRRGDVVKDKGGTKNLN